MRVYPLLSLLCIGLFFCQCKTTGVATSGSASPTAVIVQQGFLSCFEKDLSAGGKPVWCEASAIAYDGSKLFFANDKDMPGPRSSLFYLPVQNGLPDTSQPPVYSNAPVLKHATKYEDFAVTPDGNYLLLSTGFDRVKEGSSDWDNYNTLLYWKKGDEDHPQVASLHPGDSNSVSLRQKISKALTSPAFPDGAPYFKIEGLAATHNTLYWGVREEGKKYDDFSYKIKVLASPYAIKNGRLILGDIRLLADINTASINPSRQQIALSSIEYDRYSNRFLVLTSYENKDTLGGFLWTATPEELEKGKLNLVKDPQGQPLDFHHKCEDVAIMSKNRVIVVDDDDRVITQMGDVARQPNQAGYHVVEFK